MSRTALRRNYFATGVIRAHAGKLNWFQMQYTPRDGNDFENPPPQQNPEYPILHSQPRARMFSLEYAQLLTEGEDLKAEAVMGTEEGSKEGEEANKKWNHGP